MPSERLFVYGQLEEPSDGQPAKARGQLRQRLMGNGDSDAAARFDMSGSVYGQVVDVPTQDLLGKDKEEAPEYVRRRIKLDNPPGMVVWAYQFGDKKRFESFPIVPDGHWKGQDEPDADETEEPIAPQQQ